VALASAFFWGLSNKLAHSIQGGSTHFFIVSFFASLKLTLLDKHFVCVVYIYFISEMHHLIKNGLTRTEKAFLVNLWLSLIVLPHRKLQAFCDKKFLRRTSIFMHVTDDIGFWKAICSKSLIVK
jgi:hypothetical protein